MYSRFKVGDFVRSAICDDATAHEIAQVRTEENKTGRAVYRLKDVQGLHAEVNLRSDDELTKRGSDALSSS